MQRSEAFVQGASIGMRRLPQVGDARMGYEGVRAAIVAHSAAGWIARILLGIEEPYWGRLYKAGPQVHTLVTLGTPHVSQEKITMKNLSFVATHCPGCAAPGVRYVCVAGTGVQGKKVSVPAWAAGPGAVDDTSTLGRSTVCVHGWRAWGCGLAVHCCPACSSLGSSLT